MIRGVNIFISFCLIEYFNIKVCDIKIFNKNHSFCRLNFKKYFQVNVLILSEFINSV